MSKYCILQLFLVVIICKVNSLPVAQMTSGNSILQNEGGMTLPLLMKNEADNEITSGKFSQNQPKSLDDSKDKKIPQVTVYPYNNFEGTSDHFKIHEKCFNLPGDWQKRISSLNTHSTCVEVCQHKNCQGRCSRVAPGTPGHNRLRDINFDKRIISIKHCA